MKNKNFLPVVPCITAAADPIAGVLLHRLLMWTDLTKVRRAGHRWVTKTREQWGTDTGLSVKQVRRALDVLSERGLVVREKHIFMGKTPLFLRPSSKMLASIPALRNWHQTAPKGTDWSGPEGTDLSGPEVADWCGPLGADLEDKQGNKQEKEQGKSALAPPELDASPDPEPPEKIPGKKEGDSTVPTEKEVTVGVKVLPAKNIALLQPDRVQTMTEVWRLGMSKRGYPVPAISMKVRGQLKHLIKMLPAGDAPAHLRLVMEEWEIFTTTCRNDAGAFNNPQQPEIGYIVKHVGLIPGFVCQQREELVKEAQWAKNKAKQKAEQLSKPAQSMAPIPQKEHVPATIEEMEAIEKALGYK